MRPEFASLARPLAAAISAIVLTALVWADASTAFAGVIATPANAPATTTNKNTEFKRATPDPAASQARRPPVLLPLVDRTQGLNRRGLGAEDEIATLHAIHNALSSIGDGGAFVWQRAHGRLSGLIRPTTSFKTSSGEICRHILLRLNSSRYSREVEGIACRNTAGVWTLSG